MEPVFKAPTEEIELEIINFCIHNLKLPFGTFWYQWFGANNPSNVSLHIDCNDGDILEKLRQEIPKLSFFGYLHMRGLKRVDIRALADDFDSMDYMEFDFKYQIHFKLKE